jgi:hypothetical protein
MPARVISAYALASLDEMKRACGVDVATVLVDGTNFLDNLYDSLEFASDEVERYLSRHLVTRAVALTEYHTAQEPSPDVLYLRQYPVISAAPPTGAAAPVVALGSWSSGAWVLSETLVAGTDYLLNAEVGTITSLSGDWSCERDAQRVVYWAGYTTTAAVPAKIRRLCLGLAQRRFAEINGGLAGVQSKTDGLGTLTRFLPAELLTMEQQALDAERRFRWTGRVA